MHINTQVGIYKPLESITASLKYKKWRFKHDT